MQINYGRSILTAVVITYILMTKILYKQTVEFTTRIRRPIAFGGKFLRNLARTAPLLPCGRVTLPQTTRKWLGFSWPGHAVFLNS